MIYVPKAESFVQFVANESLQTLLLSYSVLWTFWVEFSINLIKVWLILTLLLLFENQIWLSLALSHLVTLKIYKDEIINFIAICMSESLAPWIPSCFAVCNSGNFTFFCLSLKHQSSLEPLKVQETRHNLKVKGVFDSNMSCILLLRCTFALHSTRSVLF